MRLHSYTVLRRCTKSCDRLIIPSQLLAGNATIFTKKAYCCCEWALRFYFLPGAWAAGGGARSPGPPRRETAVPPLPCSQFGGGGSRDKEKTFQ